MYPPCGGDRRARHGTGSSGSRHLADGAGDLGGSRVFFRPDHQKHLVTGKGDLQEHAELQQPQPQRKGGDQAGAAAQSPVDIAGEEAEAEPDDPEVEAEKEQVQAGHGKGGNGEGTAVLPGKQADAVARAGHEGGQQGDKEGHHQHHQQDHHEAQALFICAKAGEVALDAAVDDAQGDPAEQCSAAHADGQPTGGLRRQILFQFFHLQNVLLAWDGRRGGPVSRTN